MIAAYELVDAVLVERGGDLAGAATAVGFCLSVLNS